MSTTPANVTKNQLASSDEEYVARIVARLEGEATAAKRTARAWLLARSAEDHFARLEFAQKRKVRAKGQGDAAAALYESEVILALLYEIADTAYLVVGLLDFTKLELSSSEDGRGIVGDAAGDIVKSLTLLNNQAARLLEMESISGVRADFTKAVDEKEGITFVHFRHWQDMVPGSVAESFRSYFAQAKATVASRLGSTPEFWASQSVRQYLEAKRYTALLTILDRLVNSELE